MKRFEVMAAVLLGVLGGLWYWNEPQDTPPREIMEIPSPKIIPPPKPSPAKPVEMAEVMKPSVPTQPSIAKSDPPDISPPPAGRVEFEIKEGIALTQGDIVLGKLENGDPNIKKGVARTERTRLWPSNQIPYSIGPGVSNRTAIEEAIAQFHAHTQVRFIPYTGQADSLVFAKSKELCASYLGRVGGAQPLFLSPNCGVNEILHELMHALGFVHEHSRPDRDQYIEILWDNIDPRFWSQFWMIPDEAIHEYTGPVFNFDPQSIMLYDSTAFALRPGTTTLRAKNNQVLQPSRNTLSRIDRERIFYLYGR